MNARTLVAIQFFLSSVIYADDPSIIFSDGHHSVVLNNSKIYTWSKGSYSGVSSIAMSSDHERIAFPYKYVTKEYANGDKALDTLGIMLLEKIDGKPWSHTLLSCPELLVTQVAMVSSKPKLAVLALIRVPKPSSDSVGPIWKWVCLEWDDTKKAPRRSDASELDFSKILQK